MYLLLFDVSYGIIQIDIITNHNLLITKFVVEEYASYEFDPTDQSTLVHQ